MGYRRLAGIAAIAALLSISSAGTFAAGTKLTPEQRLDALQTALSLQPNQEAAWQSYKSAVVTARADRVAWRTNNPRTEGLTLPQRIDRRQAMMQALGPDRLAVDTALKQLYSTLTPQQQVVLEIHFARKRRHPWRS